MFLTALLSLATATATAADKPAPAPIKLAAPGLNAVNVDDKVAAFFNDHLAQQYTLRGIRVTTPTEITALVGVERQKQLVGCSESSSSCIAEIADALGVDGVITGSMGKFGSTLQLNVKILRSSPGDMLDVFSLTASSEEQLLKQITDQAVRSADAIAAKLNRHLVSSASSPGSQGGYGSSQGASGQYHPVADAAQGALPQNVITIGPLSAVVGFFAVEYERALGSSFSVFVSPQYVYMYLDTAPYPTLAELLVGGRFYVSGSAPDGMWIEAHVGAGTFSSGQLGNRNVFSAAGLVGYTSLKFRPVVFSFGVGLGYEPQGVLLWGYLPVFATVRANIGFAF